MTSLRVFTEEPRGDIIKSIVNNSTSKSSWTFSKQRRFKAINSNCPNAYYDIKTSTLSSVFAPIGKQKRKIFTENSQQIPSSWNYNPQERAKTTSIGFAEGREKVIANSYIAKDPIKNPGPGNYNTTIKIRSKSYSIRPKTAHHRNYFIKDEEKVLVPGPGNYQTDRFRVTGSNILSKFKNTTKGIIGKQKRFQQDRCNIGQILETSPGSWTYDNGVRKGWVHGPKIGHQIRNSFTQKGQFFTPGPGNYKLPSQFGHYKPFKRSKQSKDQ